MTFASLFKRPALSPPWVKNVCACACECELCEMYVLSVWIIKVSIDELRRERQPTCKDSLGHTLQSRYKHKITTRSEANIFYPEDKFSLGLDPPQLAIWQYQGRMHVCFFFLVPRTNYIEQLSSRGAAVNAMAVCMSDKHTPSSEY